MTVRQIKEKEKGNFAGVEIYKFRDNEHIIHADYIIAVDDVDEETEAADYRLMGEEEYNKTIYACSSYTANFEGYYDDKNARVLVIVLGEHYCRS